MMPHKLTIVLIVASLFLYTVSCSNKPKEGEIKTIDVYVVGKDTCNMTVDGKRQGKWVPNYNNDLKDTVYYRDGIIVPK